MVKVMGMGMVKTLFLCLFNEIDEIFNLQESSRNESSQSQPRRCAILIQFNVLPLNSSLSF